jgi:uncharacterized protein (DUF1330 family)
MSLATSVSQYYQLNLIWPKDRDKSRSYQQQTEPILASHGGSCVREYRAESILSFGIEKPDAVCLLCFPSMQAFVQYQHDDRLQRLTPLRREAVQVATVEGTSMADGANNWDVNDRPRLIEIASFGSGGIESYRKYEAAVAPLLERYRVLLERSLNPEYTNGLPFRADVVKISYSHLQNGISRLLADVDYESTIRDLYRSATRKSMLLIGKEAEIKVAPSKSFS